MTQKRFCKKNISLFDIKATTIANINIVTLLIYKIMNPFSTKRIVLALSLVASSSFAYADNLSISLSTYAIDAPYKNTGVTVRLLPYVRYENGPFFIRGLGVGLHLVQSQNQELNLIAEYSPFDFKPRDSDNAQLKQLNSRKPTVMSGVAYELRTDGMGAFHAQLTADVLSRSKGLTGDINYKYPINYGNFTLTPMVGTLWNSRKQNDYYYGISGSESARSGLPAYQSASAFLPYAGVSAVYPITQHLNASLTGRYVMLPNAIKDSPMVNKSGTTVLGAGLGYSF